MLKDFIRAICPPFILNLYRRVSNKNEWTGHFTSWAEASRQSVGYDSDAVVARVKDAALKVKHGTALYERDSVLFDKIEYAWPLLAGLMWVAAKQQGKLRVLDFGGSLGSTYFQNRHFLSSLSELKWSVVEQENFVACGKEFFEDDHLKFFNSMDDCFKTCRPSIVLFSCVLQYLEKPLDILESVFRYKPECIVVDNMPFNRDGKDRITVQQVDPGIYEASYPCWMLDRNRFLAAFEPNYTMVAEFISPLSIRVDGRTIPYEGFIFERK